MKHEKFIGFKRSAVEGDGKATVWTVTRYKPRPVVPATIENVIKWMQMTERLIAVNWYGSD